MEENTQLEDIIEDVTVEQLAAGLELEQESTIVSEEQVVETEEVTLEEEATEEETLEEAALIEFGAVEGPKSTPAYQKAARNVPMSDAVRKLYDAYDKIHSQANEVAYKKLPAAKGTDNYDKVRQELSKLNDASDAAHQKYKDARKAEIEKALKDFKEPTKNESYEADLAALTESEANLTESFKEKAAIIFEAAVTSKIREEKEKLAEQFETQLSEQTAQVREDLAEKVDNYLTYVVESWVEDNKVAIESGLRAEIAENFIGALKTVFVENYIEVPESKKDLVSELEVELAGLKESAALAQADATVLSERVEVLVREKVLAEAALTLADTQAAKLANLVQDVEFVSEDTFRNKVETIKEAYFSNKDNVKALEESSDSVYETIETIVEGEDFSNEISPSMAKYLTAVSRLATAKG